MSDTKEVFVVDNGTIVPIASTDVILESPDSAFPHIQSSSGHNDIAESEVSYVENEIITTDPDDLMPHTIVNNVVTKTEVDVNFQETIVSEASSDSRTQEEIVQTYVAAHIGHDYSQPHPSVQSITVLTKSEDGTVSHPDPLLETSELQVLADDDVTVETEDVMTASPSAGDGTQYPESSEQPLSPTQEGGGAMCLVCTDKGSGYHYSVFSCEGCKGFFKRTIQKSLNYTCKESQDCNINKYTRNNCQYCRFQKCIAVGMKREAVREDRTPGGKHRHKRLCTEEGMANANVYRALQLSPEDDTEPLEDETIQKLMDAQPDLIPTGPDVFPTSMTPQSADQMDINDLMQYGYMELRMIIEWARKIPGFSELLIEDQMALLKSSFMELNVFRLAYRSMDMNTGVRFATNIVMTVDEGANIGWGKDLISYTIEFATTMKEIAIDHTEFSILNAIILSYPDATGIQDRKAVAELQSSFLDCLRKYSLNMYPSEPRRYPRILLRLPTLRALSAKAAERFLSMSLEGTIKMNSLVLEMMS